MLLRPQLNCVALYHAEIFYRVAQWHPLLESFLSSSLSAEVSFRVARLDVGLNSFFFRDAACGAFCAGCFVPISTCPARESGSPGESPVVLSDSCVRVSSCIAEAVTAFR